MSESKDGLFRSVRTLVKDGEIWFVAKDVAAILGIANFKFLMHRLGFDMKRTHAVDTPEGKKELGMISEAGLYKLISFSENPKAEAFKWWATSKVILCAKNDT